MKGLPATARPTKATPTSATVRDRAKPRRQNLVTVSAGLALSGKIPFVYSIATFMSMRPFEQIRNDVCYHELPVTVVFESPTVAELAMAIGRARGEESAEDLEALLALVEGLSPEEAATRLAGLEA